MIDKIKKLLSYLAPSVSINVEGVFFFLVPFFMGIYAIYIGQPDDWDFRNYHFYNAYAFLNNRFDFDLFPGGQQTFFNPLLDTFFYALSKGLNSNSVSFIVGFFQGISFIFLYKISYALFDGLPDGYRKTYSILLGIFGILSTGFISEVGSLQHDSLTAVLILVSLYLCIRLIKNPEGRSNNLKFLFFSGLAVGLASGFKLTNLIYFVSLFIPTVLLIKPLKNKINSSFIFCLGFLLGFLVTEGFWMYKLWVNFKNPIFPYFDNLFNSVPIFPDIGFDKRFYPKNIFETFFWPFIFTINPNRVSEIYFRSVIWAPAYLLFFLFSLKFFLSICKSKLHSVTEEGKFFIIFCGISYLLWLKFFGIYRYLIAIEVLLPILFVILSQHLVILNNAFKFNLLMFFLLFFSVVNFSAIPNWGRIHRHTNFYPSDAELNVKLENASLFFLYGQPTSFVVPLVDKKIPVVLIPEKFKYTSWYSDQIKKFQDKYAGDHYIVLKIEDFDKIDSINSNLSINKLELKSDACLNLFNSPEYKNEFKACLLNNLR